MILACFLKGRNRGLRVGLDDLAQRVLPEVRAVTLPVPGEAVREGEVAAVVSCGERRAEVISPVNGTVAAVNCAVGRDPSLLHTAPCARGWLFDVAPADSRYLSLLSGESARSWLRKESARLNRFLERELGLVAADGGEFLTPPPALLRHEQWEALAHAFLKAEAKDA